MAKAAVVVFYDLGSRARERVMPFSAGGDGVRKLPEHQARNPRSRLPQLDTRLARKRSRFGAPFASPLGRGSNGARTARRLERRSIPLVAVNHGRTVARQPFATRRHLRRCDGNHKRTEAHRRSCFTPPEAASAPPPSLTRSSAAIATLWAERTDQRRYRHRSGPLSRRW